MCEVASPVCFSDRVKALECLAVGFAGAGQEVKFSLQCWWSQVSVLWTQASCSWHAEFSNPQSTHCISVASI